ncbi:MAG: formylglycine-generating enzyme family protein [Planctomycetales bacterium]|nr:formylglycine-generating enzyme family protein [Planctomycetales bacterium]
MGSHLLVLRKPGLRDTRYPVLVERRRDVRVAERIPLLADEQIGAGFVWVPPGEAILGGDPAAPNVWPRRRAFLPGFCLSEREVTFAEYGEFILAVAAAEGEAAAQKRCPRRYAAGEHYWRMEGAGRIASLIEDFVGDRPAVAIAWDDAVAYCEWRGARDGRPLRLPTETEWERAGRGADGRHFPWGSVFSWRFLSAGRQDGRVWIRPVGSAEADVSPFGLRDMAGSASEWCSDSPEGLPDHRMTRGGAWALLDKNLCRLAARTLAPPIVVRDQVGFRVAAAPRPR